MHILSAPFCSEINLNGSPIHFEAFCGWMCLDSLFGLLQREFKGNPSIFLVLPSPFFPGILLSGNLRKPKETDPVLEQSTMVFKEWLESTL